MEDKHCSQLTGLPRSERDVYRSDLFSCKLTGKHCIARTYEDPDPMLTHKTGGRPEANYIDPLAERTCPAYNISDDLAKQLRDFRLSR